MILVNFFEKFFLTRKIRVKKEPVYTETIYNIQEIYNLLNETYFQNKISVDIRWFGNKRHNAYRKKILGMYDSSKNMIKIHRVLDHSDVPYFFVSYIIYHEMLHVAFPPKRGKKGRWQIHHGEFKKNEKSFSDYAIARDWEKKNKHRFLLR